MATNPQKDVRRDDFVKILRPDLKSNEPLVLIQGYIGDSDLEGHIRIYSDARLSDFIELPEQEILFSSPVEASENPLGGSRVWVRKTTVFTTGDPRHANRIKSSFLEGDLIKAFGDQGGKIPRVIGGLGGIRSEFLVGGCGPVTRQFEDCRPTGPNNPICQIYDPTIPPHSQFNATCPQNPCTNLCNPSHPIIICFTVNNRNCEVAHRNTTGLAQQQGIAKTYTGRFNPYEE